MFPTEASFSVSRAVAYAWTYLRVSTSRSKTGTKKADTSAGFLEITSLSARIRAVEEVSELLCVPVDVQVVAHLRKNLAWSFRNDEMRKDLVRRHGPVRVSEAPILKKRHRYSPAWTSERRNDAK